ncbi:hypothetical protein [uncultured Lactobacillus sp.]|uniref:crAss001_48 related protein n=1 Tax=uncultured Lactobacillus sp. TaxID=153152 RepID=UPI00261DBA6A|nr:hypothetical protein [uncultured Lactobacillus sp.]
MAFYQAKPKDQVIKKLKEEQNILNNKIFDIDSIFSNDTDISKKQLGYMEVQRDIMESLVTILDLRIEDLDQEK